MDDVRARHLSQCHVRHKNECGETRENVTCEGVLFIEHDSSFVLLVGRPLLLSSPGMSPFSRIDWMLKEQHLCKKYSFQLYGIRMCSINIARNQAKEFWNPHSNRTSFCCFLHEQVEANGFSEKSRAPCFANAFSSTVLMASQ